jgi:uncharacterized protein (DUF305 family)
MGMEHDADFSGVADVDQEFAAAMIAHHRGAITMAKLAQTRGQHDEIKSLADAIVADQEREIGLMEKHAGAMEHGG